MKRKDETNNKDCIGEALQILYGLDDPSDLTDLVHLLKKAGDRQ